MLLTCTADITTSRDIISSKWMNLKHYKHHIIPSRRIQSDMFFIFHLVPEAFHFKITEPNQQQTDGEQRRDAMQRRDAVQRAAT